MESVKRMCFDTKYYKMSLINISKQWDKWDKRLKNLFFQIEIVPSDLGAGGERVRPWQKIICLVPTWGKKDLADFFLSFTILKGNNSLDGIKVNVGGRALEDLHGIDVVAN